MLDKVMAMADRLVGKLVPTVTAEAGEEYQEFCYCRMPDGAVRRLEYYRPCRTLPGGGSSCGQCQYILKAC